MARLHRPMTKILVVLALGVALIIPRASADAIFGRLTRNGLPEKNVAIKLECPGLQPPAEAFSNASGDYILNVPVSGPCTLVIGTATFTVVLRPEPTQYSFEILPNGSLRQR